MKAFTTILALAAALSATTATAAADEPDFYLGAIVGSRGNINLADKGVRFERTKSSRTLGWNGGYRLNQHLALEAGYLDVGDTNFVGNRKVDIDVLYTALKGSYALSESFTLYGKLGVSRTKVAVSGLGAADGADTDVKPMYAAGVEYRLSERFGLSLGLANYGNFKSPRGQVKMRQAELGFNVRF